MKKILKYGFIVALILLILIHFTHNVSKKVSEEDKKFINLLLGERSFDKQLANYTDEINFISEIQQNFNAQISLEKAIPFSSPREPKNLFEAKAGECYDRSRFLEKTFIYYGFKTRHLTAFTLRYDAKVFKVLISKNHITHSTFEVKTKKGWLVVDPNFAWLTLKSDNTPLSYRQVSRQINKDIKPDWLIDPPHDLMHFYVQESFCIYGLYSRHGRFYPPYDIVPDYNLRELFYNF